MVRNTEKDSSSHQQTQEQTAHLVKDREVATLKKSNSETYNQGNVEQCQASMNEQCPGSILNGAVCLTSSQSYSSCCKHRLCPNMQSPYPTQSTLKRNCRGSRLSFLAAVWTPQDFLEVVIQAHAS